MFLTLASDGDGKPYAVGLTILVMISSILSLQGQLITHTERSTTKQVEDGQTTQITTTTTSFDDTQLISPSPYKQWCGKNYEPSAPAIAPDGQFQLPLASKQPLLAFGCTAAIQPYLEGDDPSTAYIVVDASMVYYQTNRSMPVPQQTHELQVVVFNTQTNKPITSGVVPLNTLGNRLRFNLEDLGQPCFVPFELSCKAYVQDQWLTEVPMEVKYLPSNLPEGIGNAVRMNAETGTLMVTDIEGEMLPFIPFGFFTAYDKFLDSPDLDDIILDFQNRGVNTVHPIPGVPYQLDLGRMSSIFSSLGKAGLWIQYDMRNSYKNITQVNLQLKNLKPHANLLAYYTADEPDGSGDEINTLSHSTEYIKHFDPYHPVSLTLNCADYHFTGYTRDTDIIMTDPYPVGMKSATVSSKFGTPCNSTYGDCGCDNCRGEYLDLSYRLRVFRERRHYLGKDRTMQIWAVPQAFGVPDYWSRAPTGQEFLLMCTIYLIEGAVGLMGWLENHETSTDLKEGSAKFGKALPEIMPFFGLPQAFLPIPPSTPYPQETLLARVWPNPDKNIILVMVANLIEEKATWTVNPPQITDLPQGPMPHKVLYTAGGMSPVSVMVQGKSIKISGTVDGLGSGAFIIPM